MKRENAETGGRGEVHGPLDRVTSSIRCREGFIVTQVPVKNRTQQTS